MYYELLLLKIEYKNNAIPLTGGAGDDTMILKMDCTSSGALPGTESMWEPFGAGNTGRFLHFIIFGRYCRKFQTVLYSSCYRPDTGNRKGVCLWNCCNLLLSPYWPV